MRYFPITILVILFFLFTSAIDVLKFNNDEVVGTWFRDSDQLVIKITENKEKPEDMFALITEEGNHDFPCDVSEQPIYMDIIKRKDNLWTCTYLVVTIDNCSTEYYYDGKMQLTEEGKLKIICPGFKTMYYSKRRPRLYIP